MITQYEISSISSLIRDLTLISDDPIELEEAIVAKQGNLGRYIKPSIILKKDMIPVEVGDAVLFKLKGRGGYESIETLWGDYDAIDVGGNYIGVICNRGSTRLYAAELPATPLSYGDDYSLQFISAAGGIGFCTGYSPSLASKSKNTCASDVEIIGVLFDEKRDCKVNTVLLNRYRSIDILTNDSTQAVQKVLVLGTGTDVGKSTAMRSLISSASKRCTVAAGKYAGTGAYEDTKTFVDAGAVFSLDFTNVGLPSTYYFPENVTATAFNRLNGLFNTTELISDFELPPETRMNGKVQTPDLVFCEMGGDFNWANIPVFLSSSVLMKEVVSIVICPESTLSLIGAMQFLESLGITKSDKLRIFVSMPLLNPEAFFLRVTSLIDLDVIDGVFDLNKPSILTDETVTNEYRRTHYSAHADKIMTVDDVVNQTLCFMEMSN